MPVAALLGCAALARGEEWLEQGTVEKLRVGDRGAGEPREGCGRRQDSWAACRSGSVATWKSTEMGQVRMPGNPQTSRSSGNEDFFGVQRE